MMSKLARTLGGEVVSRLASPVEVCDGTRGGEKKTWCFLEFEPM